MKKIFGVLLTIVGVIASIFTGMQVANDSKSFNFLGIDVVASKANYTPLIISVVVLIIGIILLSNSRK